MKKTWLIPILLTTTSVPLVSITSCNNQLRAIPEEYLNIVAVDSNDEWQLDGFNNEHQTAKSLEGYSRLTIPQYVNRINDIAFAYDGKSDEDAPLVIKQIDFETNCVCAKFGNGTFTGCTNLETVIFPPKYKPEDLSPFGYCPKLKTFDLSNMAENIAYEEVNQNFIIDSETFPDNGQIIIKRGQTNVDGFVKYLTAKLEGKNWQLIQK